MGEEEIERFFDSNGVEIEVVNLLFADFVNWNIDLVAFRVLANRWSHFGSLNSFGNIGVDVSGFIRCWRIKMVFSL